MSKRLPSRLTIVQMSDDTRGTDKIPEPPLTEIEVWFREHVSPQPSSSAVAAYDLMPSQSNHQLPFVYTPYDPHSEAHWAAAARIADFESHVPGATTGQRVQVLDVGPGDGWPSLPLAAKRPDFSIVGVEPSSLRTQVCTKNAHRLMLSNAHFITADATRMPFRDSAFDCVVASHSLEETQSPDHVFAELARVLRNDGTLRVSYQDWKLPVPEFETALLWEGQMQNVKRKDLPEARVLLYTYARRMRDPAMERRYTLVLPDHGDAARLHADALITAAQTPRAYGETLLEDASSPLGIPLLNRMGPLSYRSTVIELKRWTTAELVEALRATGFREVQTTAHPGDVARQFARYFFSRDAMHSISSTFSDMSTAIGTIAGSIPGNEMILAVR